MAKQVDILLIDDDLKNRILLEKLLKHRGYLTASAKDYNEAWNFLEQVLVKTMIIDYTIPGMNLNDFLDKLKSREELFNVLKIVFTARDLNPEDRKYYQDYYNCIALEKIADQGKMFQLIAEKIGK